LAEAGDEEGGEAVSWRGVAIEFGVHFLIVLPGCVASTNYSVVASICSSERVVVHAALSSPACYRKHDYGRAIYVSMNIAYHVIDSDGIVWCYVN